MSGRTVTSNVSSETQRGSGTSARGYALAFLAFFAVLVVLFVSAFFMDRRLKPAIGLQPLTAANASATVAAVSSAPANNAAALQSVHPRQFATTPLEGEVEDAYWRFLSVYEDALLRMDTSQLSEVLDGEALGWVTEEVNHVKAEGYPAQVIESERALTFKQVTGSAATVEDRYTSRTVRIDPKTSQPFPRTKPPIRILQVYEFRKFGQNWKVVTGTQDELGEVGS